MEDNKFSFVVSDESLNKYGTRVLTGGIDLREFKTNPVLFWNHKRDEETMFGTSAKNHYPIGRWENLRTEGGQLIADAVLDMNDPTGKKVAQKLKDGFIKAASIGIAVHGTSDSPDMLFAGQTRPTITNSKLLEISIVDIPANGNALKLSYEGQMLRLDANENVETLNTILPKMEEQTTNESSHNVGEIVTNAVQSFFDKLKASFNLTPKEGNESPDETQKELFVELNATLDGIKLPEPKDNSGVIAELKSSNESLQEQFKTLQTELITLKGQKSSTSPTTENSAPGGQQKNEGKTAEQLNAEKAGNFFKKQFKKR
jgi:HK97 family phage prohead protease